ncbi:hemerythrin domain-containing protein [Neisseria sp. ZJ106]|uniref:Hemerythrin domain-containing protein n=1 Tax=Neisseria lisongii TaxID=2912188 RepID=A0AAW5ACW9_9NEIS|nr:hemerythrin domain-containing protein [Neisseria lisongii]MCF7520795.1 hemerythrin domain-containing protein [Neisseria lisongii]MCF7528900.1 hemerythrin domain-containing protein [Neisseria lisongii]WCL70732.1 hemerythrin domain-containing protein [Neisseria lisongii]
MTDLSTWEHASFDATIDHILQRYHQVHRNQFEELVPLAEKVATVHAGSFPAEVAGLLAEMQAELLSHMMKEERMLFPMVKQGIGKGAAMPISVMMHEHDDHQQAIDRLKALTDNFQAPENACRSWQRLYQLAEEMVNDLSDHIRLENDILFQRVLAS